MRKLDEAGKSLHVQTLGAVLASSVHKYQACFLDALFNASASRLLAGGTWHSCFQGVATVSGVVR